MGGWGCLCVLQQSTAWQYPFNSTECYCGSSQQNLKITSAIEGLRGTKPTDFMGYYLLEYNFFYPQRL